MILDKDFCKRRDRLCSLSATIVETLAGAHAIAFVSNSSLGFLPNRFIEQVEV